MWTKGKKIAAGLRVVLPMLLCLCLCGEALAWFPLWVGGRCKESRFSCRTTLGNAGGRGACCDPNSPGAESCSRKDPCVGSYMYRWERSRLPLKWNLNVNGMPGRAGFTGVSLSQIQQEVTRAWNAWTAPSCSAFRHAYQGITTKAPSQSDRIVTIYLPTPSEWARLGASGALAFARPTSDSRGNIQDGDIFVNPASSRRWGFPPVRSSDVDFTEVITHEVGHSLGLAHSPLFSAVMYFSIRGDGPLFKGLGADDRDGICSLYPGNNKCTATTDCAPCFQCVNGTCAPPDQPIPNLCRPCNANADCGKGICLQTAEGGRCLQKCSGDCCPSGYRCEDAGGQRLCIPFDSACNSVNCTSKAQCGVGGFCDTTLKICRAGVPFDPKMCHRQCNSNADCGSAAYECVEYASGFKRCMAKCVNRFCPRGYSCAQTQNGQHCLPTNPDFCPCESVADCPTGRVCRNKICVSRDGGQFGEPCSDLAPCAKDLQCELLEGGQKCVITCSNKSCPNGLECLTLDNLQKICARPPSREHGDTCDGLQRRCKSGLSCVSVLQDKNEAFCVEPCSLTSNCRNGGECNLDGVPRFCQCSNDQQCGVGFYCRTLASGVRICDCRTKPCKRGCGNGVCEEVRGENCSTCPDDCKCQPGFVCDESICRKDAVCGDGTCESSKGENCGSCEKDCGCAFGELCVGNSCKVPVCGDSVCSPNQNENCFTCAKDCACKPGLQCNRGRCTVGVCGDGTCNKEDGETCSTCAQDCGCHPLAKCLVDRCQEGGIRSCGNGKCEPDNGETCFSCKSDCGCKNRFVCRSGDCVDPKTVCPVPQQELNCPTNGENCTLKCRIGGCGCAQGQQPTDPLPFLLILIGLLPLVRRRFVRP